MENNVHTKTNHKKQLNKKIFQIPSYTVFLISFNPLNNPGIVGWVDISNISTEYMKNLKFKGLLGKAYRLQEFLSKVFLSKPLFCLCPSAISNFH